ncbi:MAG TPA: YcaO-like family protein, partial [Pseudonocardia sp.]|nr:YcaO-like family protein [Pseudonocardia sp.]
PACATYLRHRPPSGAAALMSPGSAGLSAHVGTEPARRHGLLEVLERDLFWRAWYDLAPVTVPPGAPAVPELERLELERTTLLLPGPAGTACVAVCLADRSGRRQSFGARALAAVDEAELAAATEVATHEALMVRWSMHTPSARASWRDLAGTAPTADTDGAADTAEALPSGPLEHALHTFHRQDSLAHLLRQATFRNTEWPTDLHEARADLAAVLADHTGQDVVWVDSTVPAIRISPDSETVVGRVVAPGARRLPGSERRLPTGLRPRTRLPHPLG